MKSSVIAVGGRISKSQYSFALVFPLLIFAIFLFVAILTLANSSLTNQYVTRHTEAAFAKADLDHNNLIDYYEFSKYALDLPQYQSMNTSAFRDELIRVFDTLDVNTDGYITETDMYNWVLHSLLPPRHRFGVAVVTISGVALLFVVIYWVWHRRLKRENEAANDMIEGEPLLRPPLRPLVRTPSTPGLDSPKGRPAQGRSLQGPPPGRPAQSRPQGRPAQGPPPSRPAQGPPPGRPARGSRPQTRPALPPIRSGAPPNHPSPSASAPSVQSGPHHRSQSTRTPTPTRSPRPHLASLPDRSPQIPPDQP